jgi:catechol 2,3-dioxygenase-like lactoylglutathione lyase family enzyme
MPTANTLQVLDPESTSTGIAGPVLFHLSLNVANLDKSIEFYRILFDREPAKCYPDYAKFELSDPPLVLSLEPQAHASGGALNHLGFRLGESRTLVEMQRRLETAGIFTTREEGVECCYARQTKFWVQDPDANNWEVYVLEADTEHRGAGSAPGPNPERPTTAPAPNAEQRPPVIWEHQLGRPFPDRIPLADGSADQVLLRGTFNAELQPAERHRILMESRRILRAGGKVVFHGLVADRDVSSAILSLPGPAAAVRYVPTAPDVLADLKSAGFFSLKLEKFSATAVFRHESVPLRELLVEGYKSDSSRFDLFQNLLYRGPLDQVTDDAGNVYPRGVRVQISNLSAELLRESGLADRFVFFPPGE